MAFKGDDSTLSLATTVTLALAVAAMVFVKNPLQSSRPPGSGTGLQKATGELKVPARLWEDPFAAVEKAVEAQKQIAVQIVADGKKLGLVTATVAQQQGNDGLKSLYDKIKEEETPDQAILTLVVMTQGGSSVESGEVRIRDRYAVGAGLEVGCFAPEKGESLSYFTWDFPEKTDHRTPLEYTPYEWYSRNAITTCGKLGDSIRRVLVLWVKSPETDDKILARLGALLERVHPPDWKQKGKSLRVKLLGPRSSSEFRNILEEIESDLSRTPKVQKRWGADVGGVYVFSPGLPQCHSCSHMDLNRLAGRGATQLLTTIRCMSSCCGRLVLYPPIVSPAITCSSHPFSTNLRGDRSRSGKIESY
jgi:hypothetical protein